RPRRARVRAHARAAVIAFDHAPRILRVDPQVVVVAVRHRDRRERLAAVARAPELDVDDVDGVLVLRVGVAARVVPGALAQVAVLADARPGGAGIVAAHEPAVLGLDHRVDALLVGGRHRDADDAERRRGHALVLAEVGPGLAAVGRLPQRRTVAAALERVRR